VEGQTEAHPALPVIVGFGGDSGGKQDLGLAYVLVPMIVGPHVAQITVPPEDDAEHVVEFGERHLIGDRDQADDHRAHLAQNRSQNQALEGGCCNHLSSLLDRPTPELLVLSRWGLPKTTFLRNYKLNVRSLRRTLPQSIGRRQA
jgi:hypothetical protein